MGLHHTPEDHDADPPARWQVVKVADRCWHLVSSLNSDAVFEYCTTRKAAEAARSDSSSALLYEKESRWFRGEPVANWKPYAVIVAERERRAAWLAARAS